MLLFNKTYILEGGGLYQALDVEESNLYKETHINSRGCVFFSLVWVGGDMLTFIDFYTSEADAKPSIFLKGCL